MPPRKPCAKAAGTRAATRSEEHTSELQSRENLVCRLLLEKKKSQGKVFDGVSGVLAIKVSIYSNQNRYYCELASDPDTQKCYELMVLVHALLRPFTSRFND